MHNTIKTFLLLIMAAAIAGCDGGGEPFSSEPDLVRIGNGQGGSFQKGVLAIGLTTLSSGGSSIITATLVDANGSPYTQAASVTFSSNCISSGLAKVGPLSPITFVNGVATTTYTAQGCSGNDKITAIASVSAPGVGLLSATGTINVLPPTLGSVEFVSATPPKIALKGTGGAGRSETSVVVFRVKDTSGNIVVGKSVSFSLNTTVGDLFLTPLSALSDSQGLAQTVVAAGTVATSVRVIATITGTSPPISTQSSELVVTSGIPDQDSFSLSIETLNPEAFDPNQNGVTSEVTIHVGDHFNNPVPDGTAVAFITEGGQIASSCTTVAGACSINWTSSNPRPTDGRVTILATAIGNESFVDGNGDGRLDVPASGETFTDLPEAFRDDDEDGARDPIEPFLDFNTNAMYDLADGKYNGILCTDLANAIGGICDAPKSVNVRGSGVIVMSGSEAFITITPSVINLPQCSTSSFFSNTPQNFTVRVRDLRGNVMPKGTTITVTPTNGTPVGSWIVPPVPNTTTPTDYVFTIKSDATQASTIAFSDANYSIGEGGAATITVNRNGGSTGAVSVDYATSFPVTAPSDYTVVSGTLNFAAGVQTATFFVPTTTDAPDDNETVALTLSNPTGGAALGTAAATLTIIEGANTIITQPNPPTPPHSGSGVHLY